ncbi:glycosyltransferase [Paenibacillus piscarius]|uniref:tetratricopeptide repeat-containing glycosyltransferase family 2 protein n=1 Tax=Paenibacillus piscarius TaxID=1089681 RepID=UPI001EE805FA|nr:glycosyltransferase [Paenibacillus piscarius]
MNITTQKPLITLCMIVRNEADTLARCLRSIQGAADEIIVVDTGSTDSTCSIARSFGARIIRFPWKGNFAAARNAGLDAARGTWILVLDADEELDPGSINELLVCAKHLEYEAFFVRIHNHQGTDRNSQTLTVNPILRMFKNNKDYRFNGIVHEQIAAGIVQATPNAAMHMSPVIVHHYGYAEGVVQKKDKISRNLELLKTQLERSPEDAFNQFNLAVEYMRLGDYGQALKHIRTSLDCVDPNTSYIHLLYKYELRCLAVTGNIPGALEACDRGISHFPDYPDLHHLKGALLLQVSAFIEAKAALSRALAIGASPPLYHTEAGIGTYHTHTLMGQVCQQIGQETEALACFTRAAQLHPEPWPVIVRLVRLLKCTGRGQGIYGWMSEHLPAILAEQRRKLARLLVMDGCYAAAAEVLESGAAQDEGEDELGAAAREVSEPDGGSTHNEGGLNSAVIGAGESKPNTHGAVVKDLVEYELDDHDTGAQEVNELLHPAGKDRSSAAWLKQLQRVDAASAVQLEFSDIKTLLEHPVIAGADARPAAAEAGAAAVQPWICLADKALAALATSSVFSPAAAAVRLALPLPRLAD